MSKKQPETEVDEDEQYLLDSLAYIQNNLMNLRYNIKEIKACMLVATENDNADRIQVIRNQKAKTNELIQAGMEDQKRVLSIYKRIKGGNRK
jgi:hypothetical protein